MPGNVIDVKRLPGRDISVTYEGGETKIISDFRPYIYAEVPNQIYFGERGSMANKKVFWSGKRVKTVQILLDHPSQVSKVKEITNVPIFEFDIDYVHRYSLDRVTSVPPSKLFGIAYDLETSEGEFLTGSLAYGEIAYDGGCNIRFDEPISVDSPEELIDAAESSEFVMGHNILWFDNKIMGRYGLKTHKQKMSDPKYGLKDAYLVADSLNIDTMQLAGRFITRPPSLSLKVLSSWLGEEIHTLSPAMIHKVEEKKVKKYNRKDVSLTVKLAKKLVPQLWTVWSTLKIPPSVYLRFYGRGTYETSATIFYRMKGDEYYLPSKERNTKYEGKYGNPHALKYSNAKMVGPFILTPEDTGMDCKVLDNVVGIDFSALFPNILVKEGISPETVSESAEGKKVILRDKDTGRMVERRVSISGRKGFFPEMMEELMEKVEKYKVRARKDRSFEPFYTAMKGIFRNNQTHGSFTSVKRPSGCRFINILAGGRIFASARNLAEGASRIAEDMGGSIISVDTDGFFAINVEGSELKHRIEEELGYEVDLDHYDAGYFSSGKTYALLKDNDLRIKGAPLWGRNIPRVCTEAIKAQLKECLEMGRARKSEMIAGVGEFIREGERNSVDFVLRVTLRRRYKAEHRKRSSKYFSDRWDIPRGVSFDAVIVEGGGKAKLKPWATADKSQWERVVPWEKYEGEPLDLEWYHLKAKRILDNFISERQPRLERWMD